MKLLFYAANKSGETESLQRLVEEMVPKDNLEIYSTFLSLSRRLRQPSCNLNTAVLAIGSRQELREIVTLRDLLSDIRLILIVPDRGRDTISKAHSLAPRFLTYMDTDFEEVRVVLVKMLHSADSVDIQGKGRFEPVSILCTDE